MLSSVLKSDRAAAVNVAIMRVFVAMRKALASVAPILERIETVEKRQITDQAHNEERFDAIFKAMDGGDFPPQKVFFDGKHYDAYSFARKLVRKAKKNIVLVDNYCDDVTLDILSQKCGGADVLIATTHKSATKFISPTAVAKFNKQNPTLTIKTVGSFHDRFLILDGTELYHLNAPKKREPRFEGEIRRRRTRRALKRPRASMKDLGRQYCAITKMDAMFIPSIMQRIP